MTKNADAVKIFKTRDSATSLLRKLGIKPRDYNFYIEKMTDGRIACQVARAEMYLESLKQPSAKPTEKLDEKQVAAKRLLKIGVEGKPKRESISQTARDMILAGKTNEEVWAALQQLFNLDHSKRHYPTWYRCEMRRKGIMK